MKDINWSEIALFSELSQEETEKLKPIFEVRKVEAGENVIIEDEEGDELFVLVDGRVRITKSMLLKDVPINIMEMENPKKVLATLSQQTYPLFGEMALLDKDKRSATVEALEDSFFLVTSRDKFFSLVRSEPDLGVKLLEVLGRRLAATVRKNNADLVKLTTALGLALSRK